MAFAPVKRVGLAEQVATSIRNAILGGKLTPGDSLPSERGLATEFGVTRGSVREAIQRLEALGLVEVRQGGATRVRNYLITGGLNVLPYLISPGGVLDPKLLGDLLELRTLLLGWTAGKAAENGDAKEIIRLEQILDELEAAQTPQQVQELDFQFYEQLVAMTSNRVLAMLAHAVREVYRENMPLFELLYEPSRFNTARHREALEAIKAHDGATAAAAMDAYGKGWGT